MTDKDKDKESTPVPRKAILETLYGKAKEETGKQYTVTKSVAKAHQLSESNLPLPVPHTFTVVGNYIELRISNNSTNKTIRIPALQYIEALNKTIEDQGRDLKSTKIRLTNLESKMNDQSRKIDDLYKKLAGKLDKF